jgi:hypothetical protein
VKKAASCIAAFIRTFKMYIVVIAWLYVVILMAVLEKSVVGGLMTFTFYGLVPLSILLYVTGTPKRWKRRKQAERSNASEARSALSDQPVSETDRSHSQQNQTDLPH